MPASEVFTGASGMKVYRRDAFPRAWAVHELLRVASVGEGNIAVGRDPESFRRKAYIVEPPPRVEACAAPETVQLIEHDADRLSIRADMACDGMVVLSDAFYPGWRARVDHRPAEIYEVNGAMRGVAVPRGSHTVTMRYRPGQRLPRRGPDPAWDFSPSVSRPHEPGCLGIDSTVWLVNSSFASSSSNHRRASISGCRRERQHLRDRPNATLGGRGPGL